MSFTLVTVTGHFLRADGSTPDSGGEVLFELVEDMINGSDIVAADQQLATTDANGDISIVLAATDDPGTTPIGVVYHVTEHHSFGRTVEYDIALPSASPTLDLATAVPVTASSRAFAINGGTP